MKPFKGKWQEHGQIDDQVDRASKKARRGRRQLNEDEEMEFQSWMNRPTDASTYLDDEEDFRAYTRRA